MKIVLIILVIMQVWGNRMKYYMNKGQKLRNKDNMCQVHIQAQDLFGDKDKKSVLPLVQNALLKSISREFRKEVEISASIGAECEGMIDLGQCYGKNNMVAPISQSVEFLTGENKELKIRAVVSIFYDSKDQICELMVRDPRQQYSYEGNGDIILTYSLGSKDHMNYQSMLQMVSRPKDSKQQLQKCHDIIVKKATENVYFYVNNNNMLGNIIKDSIKNEATNLKCRKTQAVEVQEIQINDDDMKIHDSFKDAIMYTKLRFIRKGKDAISIKNEDGGAQLIAINANTDLKVDQKQCYDMARKNLNIGSSSVATNANALSMQFRLIGKLEKNQKNQQSCYYYGYKRESIQNELLFILPVDEGYSQNCELTEQMLEQSSKNMQFLASSRSIQGSSLFSYYNNNHDIYCHVIDSEVDSSNSRNNRIYRYINSFCSQSFHSQQEDKEYIQSLQQSYDQQKTQEKDNQIGNIEQYTNQQYDKIVQKFITEKTSQNIYYNKIGNWLQTKMENEAKDDTVTEEQITELKKQQSKLMTEHLITIMESYGKNKQQGAAQQDNKKPDDNNAQQGLTLDGPDKTKGKVDQDAPQDVVKKNDNNQAKRRLLKGDNTSLQRLSKRFIDKQKQLQEKKKKHGRLSRNKK